MEHDKETQSLQNILSKQSLHKAPAGMSNKILASYLTKAEVKKVAPALIPKWFWIFILLSFTTFFYYAFSSAASVSSTNPYGLALDRFLDGFNALFLGLQPIMALSLGVFAFMMILSSYLIQKNKVKSWT